MRRLILALLLLPMLAQVPPTLAQQMRVLDTLPRANSTMAGNRQEFSVRFDGPVDHNTSRLEVMRGEAVVRVLQPRLNANPDTLYAIAGGLPAGAYVLRWHAVARRGGEATEGSLAFSIRG